MRQTEMKRVMEAQLVEGVEVHPGSGNVFADLGLAYAEKLKIKSRLKYDPLN